MKKNRYLYLLTAALLVSTAAGTLTSRAAVGNSASYTAQYSSGNLTIGTDTLAGITYSTVSYYGMFNSGEPGMPSLPVDYLKFSVPYNATNFTVTVTPRVWINQNLDHLIYPCQVPICIDSSDSLIVALPDSSAYYSESYYPSQMAWVAGEGFLAGENHIVTVAIQPFRYFHTGNSDLVRLARTCNITLRYELSDSMSIYPIVRNDSSLREEGYQLTQSMVVNPDLVSINAPRHNYANNDSLIIIQGGLTGGEGLNGSGTFFPGDPTPIDTTKIITDSIASEDSYQYLFITTPELYYSTRRLAALKRQEGYRVRVMTLNQIYSNLYSRNGLVEKNSNGVDIICDTTGFGKIRQYLRYAYTYNGTKYVLLVGSDVPYRIEPYIPNSECFTDWYYCELGSNLLTLKIDVEPDLFVGRILAKEPEQIENYTDKLFRYEMNPGHGENTDYLKQSLFTASDLDKRELSKEIPFFASMFDRQDTIFEQKNANYPKGQEIIDSINTNHYGFLCSQNHGSSTRIKTYGADNQNRSYFIWALDSENNADSLETGNSLNMIQNKYRPMIYYSLACHTIPYNYNGICFGESFTTGKDYGGPVYIGFTEETQNIPSREILRRFANNLNLPEVKYNLNKAMILAKSGDIVQRHSIISKIHNYIGDPTVKIWTDNPIVFNNISITRTDHSIIVSGEGVNGAQLSYISNNGRQISCLGTSTSVTFSSVSPNGLIMVNKYNHFPYIAPIEIQNTTILNSQYVIANDFTAGSNIDENRTSGNVVVKSGVSYEIEIAGTAHLEDGFKVERGAALKITPSCF